MSYGPFFNLIFLQNACRWMRMVLGGGIRLFLVIIIIIIIIICRKQTNTKKKQKKKKKKNVHWKAHSNRLRM